MMRRSSCRTTLFCFFLTAASTWAQVTINPLLTFGGGDGWLAPGENAFLGTANNERGIAISPTNGNLYLVSRTGGLSVRVLNGATGVETGTLNVTGITGGTFTLSKIGVGGDGSIYGSNLRTGATATQTYKIYRWNSEASPPAVIFDNLALGVNSRVGDDFDVIGSGAGTRLVAGYNTGATAPALPPPGVNGYVVIDPTASAATPTTPVFNSVGFTTTPPNTGDFRLGITFVDATATTGTVIGTQGGSASSTRLSSYDGAAGTLDGSLTLTTVNERLIDHTNVGGIDLLATVDTATSLVRLYDITSHLADPLIAPVFLTSGINITLPSVANTNGAGDARFGAVTGDSVTLYAMNTNNGIQAFTVTIPEPSSLLLAGLSLTGVVIRRRRQV